ncbi:RNA polymerase II transcriptional coactivator-like isoform X2 [Diaphorina citri]|uniref:RNA polymerase II transcriptional coactivator-like isoform X2 n=1 Tax=Diaphorina citri TaxID=121845 RepID=A0A1S3DCS7_DIACI|nr:RNA polymerase II transcriptional coactivator-like isoform X2 [Diaphorina citri]KAI5707502.1 hypothetical protein M8J77_003962 [Diaphorina citri]
MKSILLSCAVVLGCCLIAVKCEEDPLPDAENKDAAGTPGKEMKEEEGVYKSWQLDNTRFVKVKEFKGKLYVDIREHYEKDGQMLPGKKGILLNLAQFKVLRDHANDINDVIEQCQGNVK